MLEVTIIQAEITNMHCQGIACTRSSDICLTSAEGPKAGDFEMNVEQYLYNHNENLVNSSCGKIMPVFYHNRSL